jgi:hypothetical protein
MIKIRVASFSPHLIEDNKGDPHLDAPYYWVCPITGLLLPSRCPLVLGMYHDQPALASYIVQRLLLLQPLPQTFHIVFPHCLQLLSTGCLLLCSPRVLLVAALMTFIILLYFHTDLYTSSCCVTVIFTGLAFGSSSSIARS